MAMRIEYVLQIMLVTETSIIYPGLFLYTKLGPVSGTKFFPYWLKKFPIDLEHSQLAEKSEFKR